MGYRIVLDWGTSAFRAALVAPGGEVVDRRSTALGIRFSQGSDFEAAMRREIGPWLDVHPAAPVYAAGMIGSRNGWIEVPYVPCPADAAALAAGARGITLADGRRMVFLAGASCRHRDGAPDVMRGEETQIVGLGLERTATIVLPGTHSKWARVEDRKIAGFRSFVTGELYDLMTTHSFVAAARARQDGDVDWSTFDRGVVTGFENEGSGGHLLAQLFGVRARMLFGEVAVEGVGDYLSGLLIGSELSAARDIADSDPSGPIFIAGSDRLVERYRRAGGLAGLTLTAADPDAVIRGALAIADVHEGPGR